MIDFSGKSVYDQIIEGVDAMFCSECGTKNEKKAKFCENCGHALEKTHKLPKEKHPNHLLEAMKQISKRTKRLILVLVISIILLLGSIYTLGYLTSSSHMAAAYFEALTSYDASKLSSFLNIEKSEFTSKKILKQLLDQEKKEGEEVINYKITSNVASNDGLKRTITFSYMTSKSKSPKKASVTLLKKKHKKWLFFDDWAVQTPHFETVSGIKLSVFKGAKVEIEGISLTNEFLDSSTDTFDIYSLPAMFETDYQVKATLPNGMMIENTLSIDAYHTDYTLELSKEDLSEDLMNQIKEVSKQGISALYMGAIQKLPFSSIQEKFAYENGDLTTLETTYQALVKELAASSVTLNQMDLTGLEVEDVELTQEGQLYVSFKMNYNYQISYSNEENQVVEHQSKDYAYVNVTLDWTLETFHFVNAKNLTTRFSKYF